MSEDTTPKQKRKRANYTADEDAFIIQEAYENKAFCQPNKQGELFADIAQKLNESGTAKVNVDGRSVRDHFFYLVKKWRKGDNYKRSLSGTCEDFSDEDRKMADMVSALDDIEEEKEALRRAKKEKKDKQQLVDDKVLLYATKRGGGASSCHASVEKMQNMI